MDITIADIRPDRIEVRLAELGYIHTGKDRALDRARTQAIKAFQIANGLSADGKVGPLTTAALFPDADELECRDPVPPARPPSNQSSPWPRQADCMDFYGAVGLHQTQLLLPFDMRLSWDRRVIVRRISVHEKVASSAGRAFQAIARRFDAGERRRLGIDLFGGSLNVRKMRGGDSYSMHAWGVAIDFDPERNALGWNHAKARLAAPDAADFWKIWEGEGWVSMGRARDFDWMHVQAARL